MGFDGRCILLGAQCVGNCHGRGYRLLRSRRLSKSTCTSLNLPSYTEMVGFLEVLMSLLAAGTGIFLSIKRTKGLWTASFREDDIQNGTVVFLQYGVGRVRSGA